MCIAKLRSCNKYEACGTAVSDDASLRGLSLDK